MVVSLFNVKLLPVYGTMRRLNELWGPQSAQLKSLPTNAQIYTVPQPCNPIGLLVPNSLP